MNKPFSRTPNTTFNTNKREAVFCPVLAFWGQGGAIYTLQP